MAADLTTKVSRSSSGLEAAAYQQPSTIQSERGIVYRNRGKVELVWGFPFWHRSSKKKLLNYWQRDGLCVLGCRHLKRYLFNTENSIKPDMQRRISAPERHWSPETFYGVFGLFCYVCSAWIFGHYLEWGQIRALRPLWSLSRRRFYDCRKNLRKGVVS